MQAGSGNWGLGWILPACNYPHPPTLNRLHFLSGLATSEFGLPEKMLHNGGEIRWFI